MGLVGWWASTSDDKHLFPEASGAQVLGAREGCRFSCRGIHILGTQPIIGPALTRGGVGGARRDALRPILSSLPLFFGTLVS